MQTISLFSVLIRSLQRFPTPDVSVWSDGSEILCRTEEVADAIADAIDDMDRAQGLDAIAHTGYYDPDEDELEGCVDDHTGWWYVDLD